MACVDDLQGWDTIVRYLRDEGREEIVPPNFSSRYVCTIPTYLPLPRALHLSAPSLLSIYLIHHIPQSGRPLGADRPFPDTWVPSIKNHSVYHIISEVETRTDLHNTTSFLFFVILFLYVCICERGGPCIHACILPQSERGWHSKWEYVEMEWNVGFAG